MSRLRRPLLISLAPVSLLATLYFAWGLIRTTDRTMWGIAPAPEPFPDHMLIALAEFYKRTLPTHSDIKFKAQIPLVQWTMLTTSTLFGILCIASLTPLLLEQYKRHHTKRSPGFPVE